MESVNSLRISAPQWWPLREGRDGKCEGRNEKCEFLARESVSSSPTVRTFGKGLSVNSSPIFNSATMVTSLPSLSLSLSLSLCISLSLSLSLSLSHRKYLTHNIGLGRIWSFVLGFRSLVAQLALFEWVGTKRAKKILATESVNPLRISAPQWWPLSEGRDGNCEGRNEKCEFLARESVNSSPIVRIFGKGNV